MPLVNPFMSYDFTYCPSFKVQLGKSPNLKIDPEQKIVSIHSHCRHVVKSGIIFEMQNYGGELQMKSYNFLNFVLQ